LANTLSSEGYEILSYCRSCVGNLNDYIEKQGYQVRIIDVLEDELSQEEDATRCLTFGQIDLLIVDSYALDQTYEAIMRQKAQAIMVIDDLANRCHECDILLDQNLVLKPDSRYEKLVSKNCVKLLGVKYALLRDEFYFQRSLSKPRTSLRRIFVSFGGSDLDNLTSMSIEAILKLEAKIPSLVADIVVGKNNPQLDQIKKQCAEHNNLQLHIQSQEVAVLINQADLALGAGGSTHWERCFLGLPALVAIVADNQKQSSELLASFGCCALLGEIIDVTAQKITDSLVSIANKPNSLLEMSKKASALIAPEDGTQKVVLAVKEFLRGVGNG